MLKKLFTTLIMMFAISLIWAETPSNAVATTTIAKPIAKEVAPTLKINNPNVKTVVPATNVKPEAVKAVATIKKNDEKVSINTPAIQTIATSPKINSTAKSATMLSEEESATLIEEVSKKAKGIATEALPTVTDTGHYISRIYYDKGPGHTPIDTNLHKKIRGILSSSWRTAVLSHGHAFRDATVDFCKNDTLYSVTYTWADSAHYQMTGEYAFDASYKAINESVIRSREAFVDKNVVRWDYNSFKVKDDTLFYHLYKLEFRDLNDNWLDAKQSFDNVPPEVYIRMSPTPNCRTTTVKK